ncbi:MAG TPA: cardiolipin synthase ClsB [Halioglobus sp.]
MKSSKAIPRAHKGVVLELLINGEQYYPRLWQDIRAARSEVMLESFIVFDDVVGGQLADELCDAAQRGLQVHLTIDGWGSAWLPQSYSERLKESGVHLHIFGPVSSAARKVGLRPNLLNRMHRKLVVIDREIAYTGGINFSDDHLAESHPEGKQDYVVRAVGSVAEQIQEFMVEETARLSRHKWRIRKPRKRRVPPRWAREDNGSEVFFVTRDNREHRSDIERFYKVAFRQAQNEIIIANAYFFPSYGFIWQLRRAVRRGTRVMLILQGKPDMAYVRFVASTLYDYLLDAGVELYEYTQRPLHGKVAVFDDAWCTVGSSNMDPLSFASNAEANLFIYDKEFTSRLRDHLMQLQATQCRQITRDDVPRQRGWRHLVRIIAFHLMRRFPNWLGRKPASN